MADIFLEHSQVKGYLSECSERQANNWGGGHTNLIRRLPRDVGQEISVLMIHLTIIHLTELGSFVEGVSEYIVI